VAILPYSKLNEQIHEFHNVMVYLLPKLVPLEFDQYLAIYTFSTYQKNFQPQNNLAQVLMAQQ
jgi:hypothetical protein